MGKKDPVPLSQEHPRRWGCLSAHTGTGQGPDLAAWNRWIATDQSAYCLLFGYMTYYFCSWYFWEDSSKLLCPKFNSRRLIKTWHFYDYKKKKTPAVNNDLYLVEKLTPYLQGLNLTSQVTVNVPTLLSPHCLFTQG